LEQFNNLEVDTRQIAHQRVPQLKNYQLQTVAEQLGIQVNRVHRALDDCKTTLKIYHKMMEKEEDSE
jgi:DNA polymerase-3 subunit alpha (Gram-positive type)